MAEEFTQSVSFSGELQVKAHQNADQYSLSVTDSDSLQTLTQESKSILIRNAGAETCHVRTGDSAATTADFPLQAGEIMGLDLATTKVRAICASGKSTTLKMIVTR